MVAAAKPRPLPAEVARALVEFLASKRSGTFVLDVKEGQVLGWRVAEGGRVQPSRYSMR
jgi:hypothetical protein